LAAIEEEELRRKAEKKKKKIKIRKKPKLKKVKKRNYKLEDIYVKYSVKDKVLKKKL